MTHRLAPHVAAVAAIAFAASGVFAAGPENRAVVYAPLADAHGAAPVRIVINESISTRIDAADFATRVHRIDENHSLRRTARLVNSLTGVTSSDLAEVRNARLRQPAAGNQAYYVPARGKSIVITQKAVELIRAMQRNADKPELRIEVKPKRKSIPIPSVPKPNKQADADEKIA